MSVKSKESPPLKMATVNQESNQNNLNRKINKNMLTEAEENLKNILKNRTLFPDSPLDETIFESDLVIKIKVPQQMYSKRTQNLEIASLISKPSRKLSNAYAAAFNDLYQEMEADGDDIVHNKKGNQLQLRKMASFVGVSSLKKIKNIDLKKIPEQHQPKQEAPEDKQNLLIKKQQKFVRGLQREQQFQYNCDEEYSGTLDAFIINYNTLLYVLQKQCGFKVRSFIVSRNKNDQLELEQQFRKLEKLKMITQSMKRDIYIFLYTPSQNLLKAANNFQIKKELDYQQIDPFINQPMDSKYRPLRYHSAITNIPIKQKLSEASEEDSHGQFQKDEKNKKKNISNLKYDLIKRKKIDRKLKFKSLSNAADYKGVVNQAKIDKKEIENYQKFTDQILQELRDIVGKEGQNCFNSKDPSQSLLSQQELKYVYFLNRGKYNAGVEKVFMQVKKQKIYIAKLKEKSDKYGFKNFKYPQIFVQFQLAGKNKSFFDRFRHLLLYQPHIINPYGDLALFNKMQRIKLAYLTLKQQIRIENFYQFDADLFALNDDYEKHGIIGNINDNSNRFFYQYYDQKRQINQQIKGGLYGSNLHDQWRTFFIWKTDFKTMRAYLGQAQTYQIFIKTKLLIFFFFLSIFGISGELIKHLIIKPQSSIYNYTPEIIFYLVYLLIATILFAVFMENFNQSENQFMNNFVEKYPVRSYRSQYRGPYIRNIIDDRINDYSSRQHHFLDRVKTFLFMGLIVLFLGIQIGYYYAIRYMIISISQYIEEFDRSRFYLLFPAHFIGYGIYFTINQIVSRTVMGPFLSWLTSFENWPTQEGFDKSLSAKIYLLILGSELIAPIDLVFIQYASKTYCSAFWCFRQLEAYTYARYLSSFGIILLSLGQLIVQSIKNKTHLSIQKPKMQQAISLSKRLANFLQFAYTQSRKPEPSKIQLYDETTCLLSFCTFVTIFPLGSFVSFFALLLLYYIQRQHILTNQRRPISKSERIEKYSENIQGALHWMLFFNFSQMFIVLQWLQYAFQEVVLAVVSTPSFYSMMLIKYITILIFMIIFQIIVKIVCKIYRLLKGVIDKRKWIVYQKFVKTKGQKNKYIGLAMRLPKPLVTIARVYNDKSRKQYIREQEDRNANVNKNKNKTRQNKYESSNSSESSS